MIRNKHGTANDTESSVLVAGRPTLVMLGLEEVLKGLEGFRLVGVASTGDQIVRWLGSTHCEVLLLDYFIGDAGCAENADLLSHLSLKFPHLKVVVLMEFVNEAVNAVLAKSGARAIIPLESSHENIISVLKKVAIQGQNLLDRYISKTNTLSAKEEAVIRLYLSGLSINEIAAELGRKKQTVSTQKTIALRKLGLSTDAEAMRFAVETGLGNDPWEGERPILYPPKKSGGGGSPRS
jgi:two-component system capsular synthesis response regulator RcsB